MPESTRCRMVVKSATKPRFGKQNVMMAVEGAEETGIQRGVFTLEVFGGEDETNFFERGDEFDLTFALAAEAEDEEPEEEEDEEDEEEGQTPVRPEVNLPPVPDVPVAELRSHIADVGSVKVLESWQEKDTRKTATPIYEARIHEIQGES